MTDWPRMESKVKIRDDFFFSAYLIENYSTSVREKLSELEGKILTVYGMSLYQDRKLCEVAPDEKTLFRVPLDCIEPIEKEEFKPGNIISLPPETAPVKVAPIEVSTFTFSNDMFLDNAILFFARNGYKAWVEDSHDNILVKIGKLIVEKPTEDHNA